MFGKLRSVKAIGLAIAGLLMAAAVAPAQTKWPTRPVKFIVTLGPATDSAEMIGRLIEAICALKIHGEDSAGAATAGHSDAAPALRDCRDCAREESRPRMEELPACLASAADNRAHPIADSAISAGDTFAATG